MSNLEFKEQVAVVTGATGGLGSAVVARLSRGGAAVVVVDLDEAAASTVAASLPGPAIGVGVDVSDDRSAETYVDAAVREYGRLDLVHLNAALPGPFGPLVDSSTSDFDRVMAVNVRGVYLGMKAALRHFEGQGAGGSLVATSSGLGKKGGQFTSPYTASKHAVLGLVRSAALEAAHLGVRVNALCPGLMDTRMMETTEDAIGAGDGASVRDALQRSVPLGRYGNPDEVAAAVVWLLSDAASYVTGAAFDVDGGVLASAGGYTPSVAGTDA